MNKNILNTGVQNFIFKNIDADIMAVLLKKSPFTAVSSKELVQQIEARKKCKKKLPTWFNTTNIYYPNKLNIEQTSSEITARYKAQITRGKSLIDLTGGFGIDSYFFSEKITSVFHCEIDTNLSEIAAHNFKILDAKNITILNSNGIDIITKSKRQFDWIYVDPSRRNSDKQKVFFLKDCLPNIQLHLNSLFDKTKNILIKTAPLLDISRGISELKNVKTLHIVAVKNEVKELLWVLEKDFEGDIKIKTVNFTNDSSELFNFELSDEKTAKSSYRSASNYLYEPNAAILKSGSFKLIGQKFKLNKIAQHTHLYTSMKMIDFPGRRFKINQVVPYNKKKIKETGLTKVNVSARNFPESVENIRKKNNLEDGGLHFLFFIKNHENRYEVLICEKLKSY